MGVFADVRVADKEHIHHIDDCLRCFLDELRQFLNLRRVLCHRDRSETEIEVEDKDELHGCQRTDADGLEVFLPRLVNLHAGIERRGIAKPVHLTKQFDAPLQLPRVLGIGVPQALEPWSVDLPQTEQALMNLCGMDMKFHRHIDKRAAVEVFHPLRLPQIELYKQQPIIIVPFFTSCHKQAFPY